MQKSRSAQNITSIIATPDYVFQVNNFFSLVLFSAVIHKIRGKKLINKTIKYRLGSFSNMQFAFFFIDFVENLEMTQIVGGGSHVLCVITTQCVRKSILDSPLSSLAK